MKWICPDCHQPVEEIKACGCRDYFCNHCNQLVSKRRVIDADARNDASAEGRQPTAGERPDRVNQA